MVSEQTMKMRLYETNLLLGRELKAGEQLSLQLWPDYPFVDFAVRALRDRHYHRNFMPSSWLAFGTDVLGFLPPGVAKLIAAELRSLEGKDSNGEFTYAHCRFVEVDRWGAAVVALSGPVAEEARGLLDSVESTEEDALAPLIDLIEGQPG